MLLDDDRIGHEHVVAVLPDVATAEAAIAELRADGLSSEQLAVTAPWAAAGGLLVVAAEALGGVFLGAFGGMLHGQPSRDEHVDLMARVGPTLAPGEVLIVCLAHDRGDEVQRLLADHGGRAVPA